MTKHIHVYLHKKPVKTQDAGFDESKIKRADDGKFSTAGAAGGNAAHHAKQAAFHKGKMAEQAGKGHQDYISHAGAHAHHQAAGFELEQAEEYGRSPKHQDLAQASREAAQAHADLAAKHEARLSGAKSRAPASGIKSKTSRADLEAQLAKTGETPLNEHKPAVPKA